MEKYAKLIADAKTYAKIEDDDQTMNSLVLAAIKFIERSTGKPFAEGDELWELIVKQLADHWFNNRGAVDNGGSEIPFSVQCLISHITLCQLYEGMKNDEG